MQHTYFFFAEVFEGVRIRLGTIDVNGSADQGFP